MSDKAEFEKDNKKFLSAKEAAAISSYDPAYITRLVKQKKINAVREGRQWLIDPNSLEDFVKNKERSKSIRSSLLSLQRREEIKSSDVSFPIKIVKVFSPVALLETTAVSLCLALLLIVGVAFNANESGETFAEKVNSGFENFAYDFSDKLVPENDNLLAAGIVSEPAYEYVSELASELICALKSFWYKTDFCVTSSLEYAIVPTKPNFPIADSQNEQSNNTYVTNPVREETVREVIFRSNDVDTSNFITRTEYETQIDALLYSIERSSESSSSSSGGGGGSGSVTSVDLTVPSFLTVSGGPITSSGTFAVTLTSGYEVPLSASTTEWATAYGWGDHSTAGYLEDGDNVSFGNATTTNLVVTSTITTALSDGCVEVSSGVLTSTGSNCGLGGGGIASLNGLSNSSQTFATSTSGGIDLNITSSAGVHTFTLAPTSGYSIPLTASTTEWAAAYASTTALTPSYIRGLLSNTATGLTYNSTTGATSLTSGYNIPLIASTTEWATAYSWGDHSGASYLTSITSESLEDLSDVASMTQSTGDLLYWTGAAWSNIATSSLGISGGGGGITSLNGQTTSSQTFATSTSGGIDLNITSSGGVHTFTLAPSSSYSIPLTASTTEWAAAYASTTALTPSYIRGLFSGTSPITFNSGTGAIGFDFTTNNTWSGTNTFSATTTLATSTVTQLIVSGQATLSNASSTNLTNTGNAYLGTINSGTWNGSTIGVPYGGTGATTLTGLLIGNGTSAFTATSTLSSSYIQDSYVLNTGDSISGNLTFSGSTANIALGSNFLSGDGDDEGIFVDGDGNVGIGTTTPSSKLTVTGDTYIGGNITATGTLAVSGATTLSSTLNVTGQTTLSSASSTNLTISSNGYFPSGIWNSSGSVGIGTTTPGNTLTVSGSVQFASTTNGIIVASGAGVLSASSTLSSSYIQDSYVLNTGDTMTGTLILPAAGLQIGASVPFSDSSGTLTLQNVDALDATTEATIESAIDTLANLTSAAALATVGTVTTGTWNATQIDISDYSNLTISATGLELSGDAIALSSGYNVPLTASTTNWNNFYDTPSTRITAGTGLTWTSNTLDVDDDYVLNTGDSISGNLVFSGSSANIALGSNYLSGDGDDEGIYVDSSGYVGIGTSTLTAQLSIQGVSGSTDDLFGIASSTGSRFVTVTSAGNVGIGTTSPSRKLDVADIIRSVSATYTGLEFHDGSSTQWQLLSHPSNPGTNSLAFWENGTDARVVIAEGGDVGIGTTTPNKRLQVYDTVSDDQFRISYDDTRYADFQVDSAGDLIVDAQGGDVRINDENFWVCESGSCPASSPSGNGNIVVENDVIIHGKLDVATIDPVYRIGGVNYATFGVSSAGGVKEEVSVNLQLSEKNPDTGYFETRIAWSELKKGSDLWLFYQVTDFGVLWDRLVVGLSPSFDGRVFYTKDVKNNALVIQATEAGEVSLNLNANRFDIGKWSNVRPDQDTKPHFNLDEKE